MPGVRGTWVSRSTPLTWKLPQPEAGARGIGGQLTGPPELSCSPPGSHQETDQAPAWSVVDAEPRAMCHCNGKKVDAVKSGKVTCVLLYFYFLYLALESKERD